MTQKNETKVQELKNSAFTGETVNTTTEEKSELTDSQRINAWYTSHAIEHYCTIFGESVEDVNTQLAKIENIYKDDAGNEISAHWLYTCPSVGAKTSFENYKKWEEQNKNAKYVKSFNGKNWYKRPFVYGNATGIKSLLNGYANYLNAKEGAIESELKALKKARDIMASAELDTTVIDGQIATLEKKLEEKKK